MRIDRSRIRVVSETGGRHLSCILGYGNLEVEFDPGFGSLTYWVAKEWQASRLHLVWRDDDRTVDQFEARILKAVAGLSAHRRIAMIRDGLLISELPHPGET